MTATPATNKGAFIVEGGGQIDCPRCTIDGSPSGTRGDKRVFWPELGLTWSCPSCTSQEEAATRYTKSPDVIRKFVALCDEGRLPKVRLSEKSKKELLDPRLSLFLGLLPWPPLLITMSHLAHITVDCVDLAKAARKPQEGKPDAAGYFYRGGDTKRIRALASYWHPDGYCTSLVELDAHPMFAVGAGAREFITFLTIYGDCVKLLRGIAVWSGCGIDLKEWNGCVEAALAGAFEASIAEV